MGLLERVAEVRTGAPAERRSVVVPWTPWDSRYVPFSNGGPAHPSQTHTGIEQALRLSPLYAGARLLADKVASLPLQQYRTNPDGSSKKMPAGSLLTQPAVYGTVYDWIHMMMVSLVLTGNAWGFVTARDGFGYPTMIEWLPPDRMQVIEDQEQPWNPNRTRIYFYGSEVKREQLFHVRAFSVPGKIEGLSPVRLFMELIASGQDALSYGASWYKSGGFPPGTFQNQEIEVDSDQADEIRRRLVTSIRRREPLVYGRDWDYKPVAVPPSEAQFIEAMQLNATQIAAILGIPPERIGGRRGDSLTYSTQEDESISLLTDTLMPWLVRIETAIFQILPQQQYARFNSNAMLKTTTKDRYDIYRTARDIGLQTVAELRDLEELDPLPAGSPNNIADDPLPLQVLIAMARGIKEIPKSMEKLVEMAPTDSATLASQEKVATTQATAAAARPGVVVNNGNGAAAANSSATPPVPPEQVDAAARAALQRFADQYGDPDYDSGVYDGKALKNGAGH